MQFHFTDRILDMEPGRWIRARKVTSRQESYWQESPCGLVMPRPLVLECLCQAGAWLVMADTQVARRAALLSVGEVEHLAEVTPGDVIEIEVEVVSQSVEMAVVSGTATVEGRIVLRASDVMCALIDSETLDDPERTARHLSRLTEAS